MKHRTIYHIAIVNHANRDIPGHWAPVVSVRRSRAIRQCIKWRNDGNRYAMLFVEDATDRKTLRPLSLRQGVPNSEALRFRDSTAVAGVEPHTRSESGNRPSSLNHEGKTYDEVMVDIIRERAERAREIEVRDVLADA